LQSAGIIAQIKDKPLERCLFVEILEGFGHFAGGSPAKLAEADVADVALQSFRFYDLDLDASPLNGHIKRLINAIPEDRQHHGGPRWPTDETNCFVKTQPLEGLVIYRKHDITT
jgi:hypothetical protein